MRRSTTLLLSLALVTVTFAAPAAVAGEAPNAEQPLDVTMPTAHNGAPSGDILIFDDFAPHVSQQAADNLALPYQVAEDQCELADAVDAGTHQLYLVNVQLDTITHCDADIYSDLATLAEEPGHSVVLSSWELSWCGEEAYVDCTAEDVDNILAALGAEGPLTTLESPPTLQATETVNACALLPNPLVPTVDTIEATSTSLIINAQGVQVTDGVSCLTAADSGSAQLVAHTNGAYVGFTPTNYEDSQQTTLPGPTDMVKLYEDLIVRYA